MADEVPISSLDNDIAVQSNTKKLYLGATKEASIFFDGTDLNIEASTGELNVGLDILVTKTIDLITNNFSAIRGKTAADSSVYLAYINSNDNVVIGSSITSGVDIDSQDLILTEKPNHNVAPATGKGLLWLRDDSRLVFTDAAGVDHVISFDP